VTDPRTGETRRVQDPALYLSIGWKLVADAPEAPADVPEELDVSPEEDDGKDEPDTPAVGDGVGLITLRSGRKFSR
jgi:hypothetical protein